MTDFGERLKGARMHAALTQLELAKKAGIAREMVSRYEAGTHVPGMASLRRLAKALGMNPGRLLTGKTKRGT